jgi:hypothetical protein
MEKRMEINGTDFADCIGFTEAVEQNRPEGVDFLLAARPQ